MLKIFKKIIREIGFMLIANSVLFTPLIASADGDGAMGAVIGAPVGGVLTGVLLVGMSKQKNKATKADKYKKNSLMLHNSHDEFLRTETNKRKLNN